MMNKVKILVYLGCLALLVISGCTQDMGDAKATKGGFVGSQVCAKCHDKIASTWKTIPHVMAIQSVTDPDDPIILGTGKRNLISPRSTKTVPLPP